MTEPRPPVPRPVRLRMPPIVLFRAFVLGGVAVAACVWALWRHQTMKPPPMLVPAPSATEIEIEP